MSTTRRQRTARARRSSRALTARSPTTKSSPTRSAPSTQSTRVSPHPRPSQSVGTRRTCITTSVPSSSFGSRLTSTGQPVVSVHAGGGRAAVLGAEHVEQGRLAQRDCRIAPFLRCTRPLRRCGQLPGVLFAVRYSHRGHSDLRRRLVCPSSSPTDDLTLSSLSIVQTRVGVNGALSEQFDKSTGAPLSAADLTWSYASFLTAANARGGHTPPGWASGSVRPNCTPAGTAQITFNELETTTYGEVRPPSPLAGFTLTVGA